MKIVMPIYRDILWTLPIYIRLHEKYWGNKNLVILGEEKYSNKYESYALPQLTCDGVIPGEKLSEVIKWYLNQIEDDLFIFMYSDYLIDKNVDTAKIDLLASYMQKHKDVILRGNLGNNIIGTGSHITDTYKGMDILEGNFLATSNTPCIWNRELYLSLLQDNWTGWDIEISMNDKFSQNDMRSIAVKPEPIIYTNAIYGRQNDKFGIKSHNLPIVQDLIPNHVSVNVS